jgi:hypothetical protein
MCATEYFASQPNRNSPLKSARHMSLGSGAQSGTLPWSPGRNALVRRRFSTSPARLSRSPTAPTARQVEQVLWAEIHRRFYSAKHRLPGRLHKTRLDLGGGSFALGFSTESRAKGVKLQGFHGPTS